MKKTKQETAAAEKKKIGKSKKDNWDAAALTLREQRNMLCEKLSFSAAEAYKLLRTNLTYTLPNDKTCRIVGVTSSLRSEGKTTTSINLSYTLAETGAKVLLIDADMRLPSVAKRLAMDGKKGLSTVLAGLCKEKAAIQNTKILDSWDILSSGSIPPNPSELLGSEQMAKTLEMLSKEYAYIVIDLPPVNIVSDALTISKLLDGILVVVRQDYSNSRALEDCIRQLQLVEARVLGFVVTDSREDSGRYGKYKRYGRRYGRYSRYSHYGSNYYYSYGYGYGQKKNALPAQPKEEAKK